MWRIYEIWLCGVDPCDRCRALAGRVFLRDEGPQPVIDTHPNCQCRRVTYYRIWTSATDE